MGARTSLASLLGALALEGCAGCAEKSCHLPVESGAPAAGDANGDGVVDLSDGMYVQRWLFRGGPPPVCEAAVDVLQDGLVDGADSFALWSHAYVGATALPTLAEDACADLDKPTDDLDCGRFVLSFDAPARATGDFTATVQLDARDLDVAGWAVSVAAEGCAVKAATVDGTAGADAHDDPPGARRMGFARTDVTSGGGAVSAVALGWLEDVTLPAADDPYALLTLDVSATTPSSGCETCTLRFADGQAAAGQPVSNLVSRLGRTYVPETRDETVRICAN